MTVAKRLRLFFGLVGVLVVLAGFALPSGAGLLGTGAAKYCDPFSFKAFQPWGDGVVLHAHPGRIVRRRDAGLGAERWREDHLRQRVLLPQLDDDRESLYMPSGSSATSPTMCFLPGDWHMRFVGKGSGRIRVTITVNSLLGVVSVLDGGTVRPGDTWTPSPKVSLLLTNVGGLLTTRAVSLRFTAVDGASQIDDVYLDPWKDT